MLRKISFITLLLLLLASADSYAKVFKVALIKTKSAFSYDETLKGYKRYVKKAKKYLDNRLIRLKIVEYDYKVESKNNKKFIKNIKNKKYDVVVTLGRRAFESVRDEITNTPIIFATMLNPYDGDMQPDDEHPNIAGIEMDIPISVQFEAFRSFVPYLQNIGVIYSDTPENSKLINDAKKVADDLDLSLIAYKVQDERQVFSALDEVVKNSDALWMIPDYNIYSKEVLKHTIMFTIENELPFMGLSKAYVKAGALFTVTRDYKDIGRQAAIMSYDVIKNGVPRDSRVQPLRKYPLIINGRTAESIDLRIPQWVSENTIKVYE